MIHFLSGSAMMPPPPGPVGPPGLPIDNIGIYLLSTAIIYSLYILKKRKKLSLKNS